MLARNINTRFYPVIVLDGESSNVVAKLCFSIRHEIRSAKRDIQVKKSIISESSKMADGFSFICRSSFSIFFIGGIFDHWPPKLSRLLIAYNIAQFS